MLPWQALAVRSTEPELMDGPGLRNPALQARVLADLAAVNRLTRTHAPVLHFLQQAWALRPPGEPVSVLDVGSGQGDLLRAVFRLARREQRPVVLTGLDLHEDSTRAAKAATPAAMNIRYLTGDVLQHDPGAVDFIISSQLAHHLSDAQLVQFLRWMARHARCGWCVADLRRHWLPHLGFRWLARLMGWHRVVRCDGTLSIARACTEAEWQAVLLRAGTPAQVRCHLPFRLSVQSARSTKVPG